MIDTAGEPQITASVQWTPPARRVVFVPGIGSNGATIRVGGYPYGHFVADMAGRYGGGNVQSWLVQLRRGDDCVILSVGLRRVPADRLAEKINKLLGGPDLPAARLP